MPQSQQAILLPAGKAAEASQVSLPAFSEDDASNLYAHLFDKSGPAQVHVQVQGLPLNAHLPSEDRLLLLHASSSSSNNSENRLASEVLLEDEGNSASIKGNAYLVYAEAGKDITLNKDWPALHDLCYGARLANIRKADSKLLDLEDLAKQFITKRDDAHLASAGKEEAKIEDEGEGDWTDEEVEKPREPKNEVDSDNDEEMEDQEANEDQEEDEEDSEGSYEDESELESDGEDDPRKKALLDMIQAAIMKDGKLDLER
jgi:hypothetical protein